jgi:hypothetical protein
MRRAIRWQRGDFITAPEISQMFGELIACGASCVGRAGAPIRSCWWSWAGRGTDGGCAARRQVRPQFLARRCACIWWDQPAIARRASNGGAFHPLWRRSTTLPEGRR